MRRGRINIGLGALYTPGTLLRTAGEKVYVIGQDGNRHWIPNWTIFDSCFLFAADIKDISQASMNNIPVGATINGPDDFYYYMPKELPSQYSRVMTRSEIDSYIKDKFGNFRKYCPDVDSKVSFSELLHPGSGDVGCLSRFSILQTIEKANLLYVNGFIDQIQLNAEYEKANKIMNTLSIMKTFWRDSLLDAGKLVVSAVIGFISGGPVGLFIGVTGALAKNIRDQNLRINRVYSTPQTSLVVRNQQAQAVTAFRNQEAEQKNSQLEASSNFKVHPALAVVAMALLGFAAYRYTNS